MNLEGIEACNWLTSIGITCVLLKYRTPSLPYDWHCKCRPDDFVDGVDQSLVYYAALAKAHVPAEMHLYARGGIAFGLRQTRYPITRWPRLAEAWLRTIKMLTL